MRLQLLGLLTAAACFPPASLRRTDEPIARRPLAALRTQGGACANQFVRGASTPDWYVDVRACAITGAPQTLADDMRPRVVALFDGNTFQDANPGNWVITVIDPDGKELLRQAVLEGKVPDVGLCNQDGCRKRSLAMVTMPADWRPGTYRITLVLGYDTTQVAHLSLTLEDRSGVPSSSVK